MGYVKHLKLPSMLEAADMLYGCHLYMYEAEADSWPSVLATLLSAVAPLLPGPSNHINNTAHNLHENVDLHTINELNNHTRMHARMLCVCVLLQHNVITYF